MKQHNFDLVAAGIDTLEVQSLTYITGTYPFLSHDSSRRMTTEDGTPKYKYRINPDKTFIDTSSYEGYSTAMSKIFEVSALSNPVKTRIDFRFDFYGEDYDRTSKANKLLLLLIAEKYDIKNRYQCIDMLTAEQKNLCIKNRYLEVEAYNKAIQEPNSCIPCRVEFRSKALYDDSDEENKELRELDKWFVRIVSATTAENFNKVIAALNAHIMERYRQEKQSRSFDDMAFLYKYEDFIFTSRQMKDLFSAMGYARADKKLGQYRAKYKGVEFFSLRQLRDYTLTFRESADIFILGNTQNQKYPKTGMI